MLDIQLLEKYLDEKNTEAAKQLIKDYFSQSPSEHEKAEAYTLIAEIYLKSSNRINEQYLADTAPALQALTYLEEIEADIKDDVDLMNVRNSLK
jgi:Tfp pilus assembly protein PilF